MALLDEDLNGDGLITPGETAPVMQTTSAPAPVPQPAPAAPAAPGGAPAASNLPPWVQQFRAAQDARRNDFRTGMDAFYGGLGKIFEGDLKGGFGQWGDHRNAQRDAFRAKMGERFKMPDGFASRLPWNQGKSGASGLGGSIPAQGIAPGEPNPAKPNDTPAQGAAKAGAWWAGGWGGGKNRQGSGLGKGGMGRGNAYGHSKPAKQPGASSTPKPKEDEEP